MSRFLLFAFMLFASTIFNNNSVVAQDTEKECEEIKQQIKDLQKILVDLTTDIEKIQQHLDKLNEAIKTHDQYKKDHPIKVWLYGEDKWLETEQKLMITRHNLLNELEDTKLTIQATKDVIDDLLNKLANCGKKVSMKEKKSSNNLFGNQGNFELCGGIGYGFSFNGGLLGQNRTFTATDRTFDGVYGSWAQGENFFIKTDFKVSNCFGVGVEFDYTYGKNIIWDQNTIGATTTTDVHYEGRYTGYSATPFIQFNPCGSNRFSPYVDLGLRLNFSSEIKQNLTQTQTSNNNTTTTIQKATLKGAFSPGIDAALGAKYSLSNRLAILAELYSSNSNFVQDKATLDKYTVNGADQLGTLNFSQKNTQYVKSFTVPTSGTDPNSSAKALRSSLPLSTIGIKFGLDYKF